MLLTPRFVALIVGLSAGCLAACAPVPVHTAAPTPPANSAEAQAPAPPAEPTAPPAEPMEGQPLAPVDVRSMTCAALSAASDDDKAYAASFLLGYRSALIHSHAVDTKRIEAIEIAALSDCAATPNALASKVFAAELIKIGAGTAPHPPYRQHLRGLPAQTVPNQAPPMQYAPVQPTPEPTPAQPTPAPSTPPQQAQPIEAPPPAPSPPAAAPPTPPLATTAPPAPSAPAPTPPSASPATPEKPTEPAPTDNPQK